MPKFKRNVGNKKPRKQPRKIPWTELEIEYCTTLDVSLFQLAKKHGVNYFDVQTYAKDQGWAEKRRSVVNDIISETKNRAAALIGQHFADRAMEMLDDLGRIRKKLINRYEKELDGEADELKTQEAVSTTTQRSEGKQTTAMVRKARMNPSAHRLGETLVKLECEILQLAAGLGKKDETVFSGDDPPPFEIT